MATSSLKGGGSRKRVIVLAGLLAGLVAAMAALGAADAITAAGSESGPPRIDMKVLLLGTGSDEPNFASWQAALEREGVPYKAIITTAAGREPITAEALSGTLEDGRPEAKYQAIIVSVGGLAKCHEGEECTSTLTSSEWAALEAYEQVFHIRQITGDIYPSATYGLNGPTVSAEISGVEGAVTTAGKPVFPYLRGPVTMDTGTYGYEAKPLSAQQSGASFQTLVEGPEQSALAGIYMHPDGVEELVETFNENQHQLQTELLSHGALNWATRGVYIGEQRNYLTTNIDDNFISDDNWDVATQTNDYNPANALRENAADLEYAAKWSQENHFRIDLLFNGSGSGEYAAAHAGSDPLLTAAQKYKGTFGWINHTWDHPELDIGCATQPYIEAELNQNNIWAEKTLGLTEHTEASAAFGNDNPAATVTGEFSALANLVPGNPGTVDPPNIDTATVLSGGRLASGTYEYAITDDFTPGGGQSVASETTQTVAAGSSVELQWEAVCHAAQFMIYRTVKGEDAWKLLGTVPAPSGPPPNEWFAEAASPNEVGHGGAQELKFTDTGGAGTPAQAPPAVNEAVESPYPQNPNLWPAFAGAGIHYFGTDSSKPYPNPSVEGSIEPVYAAGETFHDSLAQAQAVPRYPTNIYYNVSTEAQEVSEYNALYLYPNDGGRCVPSEATTCRETAATFPEIVKSVVAGMFQHVMANDPRPDYFHQTNLMGQPPAGEPPSEPPATEPTVGNGLFYSVMNPLLAEYHKYFEANAPIEQPTFAQAGTLLADQQAWNKASTGQVSGYIEGNTIVLENAGSEALSVPLTGASAVGSSYGGTQSGWTTVRPGAVTRTAVTAWPSAPAITVDPESQIAIAGEGVSFRAGASGEPAPSVQWQVSGDGGTTWTADTADAGNTSRHLTVAATTAENGYEYRAVFTNALGQATSAPATLIVLAAPEATPVLESLSPSEGAGGTVVFIAGRNFTAVHSVTFGEKPASFVTLSSTLIAAMAPREPSATTVDVTVTTAGGASSETRPADQFTYIH
jgi:hypothetical protein